MTQPTQTPGLNIVNTGNAVLTLTKSTATTVTWDGTNVIFANNIKILNASNAVLTLTKTTNATLTWNDTTLTSSANFSSPNITTITS